LSTKIHQLCDGHGRPLVILLGPGQGSDSRMFPHLLDALRVPRHGRGRPRTTPDAVLGDKAYSSRGHRALPRRRGITAVIAEPEDQKANRKRRGAKGGRPPAFDEQRYKNRNVVERSFNTFKQWRALATRYDCEDGRVPPRVVVWPALRLALGALSLICRPRARGGACCRPVDQACLYRGLASNRAPSQS